MLRARIRHAGDAAAQSSLGRDVNDAAAALTHRRQRSAHQQHRRREVDGEHARPCRWVQGVDAGEVVDDACDVEKAVDVRAEARDAGADNCGGRERIREVCGVRGEVDVCG